MSKKKSAQPMFSNPKSHLDILLKVPAPVWFSG